VDHASRGGLRVRPRPRLGPPRISSRVKVAHYRLRRHVRALPSRRQQAVEKIDRPPRVAGAGEDRGRLPSTAGRTLHHVGPHRGACSRARGRVAITRGAPWSRPVGGVAHACPHRSKAPCTLAKASVPADLSGDKQPTRIVVGLVQNRTDDFCPLSDHV
jgi:hypothetical protein